MYFSASKRVVFSYFAKVPPDHGGFPLIPFTVFVDHVKIFNSGPMQHLRRSSFWQKVSNGCC